MPTNAELARDVAAMQDAMSQILAAVSGQAAPVVEPTQAAPAPTTQAARSTATRRTVVPQHVMDHEDGTSLHLSQVYATEPTKDRPGVAFKSNGGFRVRVKALKQDGSQDGRYINATAQLLQDIRNIPEDVFQALITDARVAA